MNDLLRHPGEASNDIDDSVMGYDPRQNTDTCQSGCPPPPSDIEQPQHSASVQVDQIGSSGQGLDDDLPLDLSIPKVKPPPQIPTAGSGATYNSHPIGVHTHAEMDVDECDSEMVQIHSVPNTQDIEMEPSNSKESDCEFACHVAENVMGVPEAIIRGQHLLPTLIEQHNSVSNIFSYVSKTNCKFCVIIIITAILELSCCMKYSCLSQGSSNSMKTSFSVKLPGTSNQ